MKKILVLIAALAIASGAYAQSSCDQMVPFGYPTVQQKFSTTQLCRIQYTVKYDDVRRVPIYSAEYLIPGEFAGTNKRVNAFKQDPSLDPTATATLEDYKSVAKEYDRGHMTPFEDTKANSAASLQTFYLSNMVPQNLHLNRGLWRAIENRTRQYAGRAKNGVYVFTGPVFTTSPVKLANGRVAIPDAIYKVVIDKDTLEGVGFVTPNSTPNAFDTADQHRVPIAWIEQATGINFTPNLPIAKAQFKQTIGEEFK